MTISSANLSTAKTSELVAFYNKHRSPIKKFRDRATAERRCAELLKQLAAQAPVAPAPAPVSAPSPWPTSLAAQQPQTAPTPKRLKTYLGFVRDHSGSMRSISGPAQKDYNDTLAATKAAALANNIDTSVSIVRCGGGYSLETLHQNVHTLLPLSVYSTPGYDTPLFSSVNELIERFTKVPDFNDPEVTFIIMATTDGQNNAGMSGSTLSAKIKALQSTDRWTFTFRVPRGDAAGLIRLGIEPGNIFEWDQTARGMQAASTASEKAVSEFFSARASGVKSSKTFYTSAAKLTEAEVKAALGDISHEVQLFPIAAKENEMQIRDFVENRLGGTPMTKGAAFYQLMKTEDKVQDYKLVAIRDKETGAVYCGPEARDLIGLPRVGDVRVRPDTGGKFNVFIQSTSVNRKVVGGTQLLYWPRVGVAFKEGKSAR